MSFPLPIPIFTLGVACVEVPDPKHPKVMVSPDKLVAPHPPLPPNLLHLGMPRVSAPRASVTPYPPGDYGIQPVNFRKQDSDFLPLHTGGSGSHPNDGMAVGTESVRPVHPAFRPDMDPPRVQPVQISQRILQKKEIKKEDVVSMMNSEVDECIKKLSSKGKFVPENAIIDITKDIICQAGRKSGIFRWYEIKSADNYSKLHGRTRELIRVYCQFTPVSTLHDLAVAIAQVENVSDYDDLCMGPIVKHPVIKDLFKLPDNLEVPPAITQYQLYKYLMKLTEKRMNASGGRWTMEDYLEFVRKKEGVESVLHLCIRIRSFPLLLQVSSGCGACRWRDGSACIDSLFFII